MYTPIYTEVPMPTIRNAKLFRNGGSQAVRIPADLSFQGTEVTVRPGPGPGEVTLGPVKAKNPFKKVLEFRDLQIAKGADFSDFMLDRPGNEPIEPRDPFADIE
jgi:antitoxin VapB